MNMSMKDAVREYATLLIDVADYARYNLDCDTARDDAVFDQLHGDEAKRPTQANEPPMPHGDMNIELALLCAVGGNHDPFEEVWSRLPDRVRDEIERRHGEFVAACASGDWRKVETCAECMTADLLEAANAAEQAARNIYTEADRKRDEELRKAVARLNRMIANISDAANTNKRKSASKRKKSRNA